jgi:hypothetical protein
MAFKLGRPILAAGGHAIVWAVLIALLLAAIVGVVLYLLRPTRAYAGACAAFTFVVALLLILLV